MTESEKIEDVLLRIESHDFDADNLKQLICSLDYAGLQKASNNQDSLLAAQNSDVSDVPNANRITQCLLRLSARLVHCTYLPSAYQRELQARAISSALGLLSVDGVQDISDFSKLNAQLRERFQDLQLQVTNYSTRQLSETSFHRWQCAYLLCSSAAFARRFQQAMPVAIDAMKRAVAAVSLVSTIGFAARRLPSSLNLMEMVRQLGIILQPIHPTIERRYEALFSFQELVRMVLASHRLEHPSASATDPTSGYFVDLANVILDRIASILSSEPCSDFETDTAPPSTLWMDYLAGSNRGPPKMSSFFYAFGMLDCAAQACRIVPASKLSERMRIRAVRILQRSTEPTYRWKAIEMLLANRTARIEGYRWLSGFHKAWDTHVRTEIDTMYQLLNGEDGLPTTLPPLIWAATLPETPFITSTRSPSTSTSSTSSHPLGWEESFFPVPPEPCSKEQSFQLRPPTQSRFLGKSPRYVSSGLSPCGRMAFRMSREALLVYPLQTPLAADVQTSITPYQAPGGRELRAAAITLQHGAVITHGIVAAFRHDHQSPTGQKELLADSPGGKWATDCVAMYESANAPLIAVGGHQDARSSIRMFCIEKNGVLAFQYYLDALNLGRSGQSSRFTSIAFSLDGTRLSAISHGNDIFVWNLDIDPNAASAMCYGLPARRYSTESHALGVTSATVFHSPAQHPYALVTTSPSHERFHNGGEFSYLAPLGPSPHDAPSLRPLEHNLTSLSEHAGILAGAVSDPPHYAALLDRKGSIIVLKLDRNERGNGLVASDPPYALKERLSKQDGPVSPTCLRFYWADSCLWLAAVDASGRVVRMRFDQTQRSGSVTAAMA